MRPDNDPFGYKVTPPYCGKVNNPVARNILKALKNPLSPLTCSLHDGVNLEDVFLLSLPDKRLVYINLDISDDGLHFLRSNGDNLIKYVEEHRPVKYSEVEFVAKLLLNRIINHINQPDKKAYLFRLIFGAAYIMEHSEYCGITLDGYLSGHHNITFIKKDNVYSQDFSKPFAMNINMDFLKSNMPAKHDPNVAMIARKLCHGDIHFYETMRCIPHKGHFSDDDLVNIRTILYSLITAEYLFKHTFHEALALAVAQYYEGLSRMKLIVQHDEKVENVTNR